MREYSLASQAHQVMDRFEPRDDVGTSSAAQKLVIASEARQSMDHFVPRLDVGSFL
jgi:hypothetical protein